MPTNFQTSHSSDPDDQLTDFQRLATSPKRVRTDEGTVEERGIDDIIKADQYLNGVAVIAKGAPWGISVARAVPSSALGGNPAYHDGTNFGQLRE